MVADMPGARSPPPPAPIGPRRAADPRADGVPTIEIHHAEPELPGALPTETSGPFESKSPNKAKVRGSGHRSSGLHVRIWEHSSSSWVESHIYSHWLQADCTKNSDKLHVHLPSVSVQAMIQLRCCLERPKAVCLDPRSDDTSEDSFLWSHIGSLLEGPVAVEVRRLLGKRRNPSKAVPDDPMRARSPALEMMQPEEGTECMDVSICPVESIQEPSTPVLVLIRAEKPLNSLRYAAVVACSTRGAGQALQAARQVSQALATAFVDQRFVHEVKKVPKEQPLLVVEAFDRFLSTLTIVPTVHLGDLSPQESSRPGTSGRRSTVTRGVVDGNDALLSDTLQHQMEKMLCSSLGVPKPPRAWPPGLKEAAQGAWSHWKRCFVEVDRMDSETKDWKMTHQLRQGMEIDAGAGKRPHLPHVSASALAKIRGLISAKNVALDVWAGSGIAAVDLIVRQLGLAGLPAGASETVASALRDRAALGIMPEDPYDFSEPLSPGAGRQSAFFLGEDHQTELVAPCEDDDAFLILLVPSQEVPISSGIMSACIRFKMPIEFSQCETPVRFLVVLVGPAGSQEEMSQTGDSLAALAADEDLVGSLDRAVDEAAFTAAMYRRLDDLPVMPRSHLIEAFGGQSEGSAPGQHSGSPKKPSHSVKTAKTASCKSIASDGKVVQTDVNDHHSHHSHGSSTSMGPYRKMWKTVVQKIQKYSVPLVLGVIIALAWKNIHEDSYFDVIHKPFSEDFAIFGHAISLHFLVNDIFMCFFFGLAIKEVTEALLPGGSLSPIRRAANPLMATCGGIVGPVACYIIMTLVMDSFGAFDGMQCQVEASGRRLGGGGGSSAKLTGETEPCELSAILNGWGVPTATDISLAWMFALLIFGPGHPAINFLLLLAIVDDAIGMIIIAVAYGDKDKPLMEGKVWLLLPVAAGFMSYGLRYFRVRQWPVYILLCGPVSWVGLLKAHMHPALALAPVVPFMPATHAIAKSAGTRGLGSGVNWRSNTRQLMSAMLNKAKPLATLLGTSSRGTMMLNNMMHFLQDQENAPLHLFEHQLKLPVDIGMFFFGLANAGVKMGSVGGVTACVLTSLIVGKTLGVAGFAIAAHCCGFGLPAGISVGDLFAMGALAGVGLTVALFVSNEAFPVDPELQGQAKMGALLSIMAAGVSWAISAFYKKFCVPAVKEADDEVKPMGEDAESDHDYEEEEDDFGDVVTAELMQMMWTHRRYKAMGVELKVEHMARSVSKNVRHQSKVTVSSATPSGDENELARCSSANGVRSTNSGFLRPGTGGGFLSMGQGSLQRPEVRRDSRKHATWATGHLRVSETSSAERAAQAEQ